MSALADETADKQAQPLQQVGKPQAGPDNPPTDAQWFPDAGLGLFIHGGPPWSAREAIFRGGMLANKPWKDATITPNTYFRWAKQWKPDPVDYDKMLAAAKATRFTLWPADFGDLDTKQTFGGRNFVKEFVAVCRKHGPKVGLYDSPPDWWFDRPYKSLSMGGKGFDMDHQPTKLPPRPKDHDAKRVEPRCHHALNIGISEWCRGLRARWN